MELMYTLFKRVSSAPLSFITFVPLASLVRFMFLEILFQPQKRCVETLKDVTTNIKLTVIIKFSSSCPTFVTFHSHCYTLIIISLSFCLLPSGTVFTSLPSRKSNQDAIRKTHGSLRSSHWAKPVNKNNIQ